MKRRVIGLPEVSLGIKPKKGSKYAKGGWLPKYQDGGKLKDEVYGRKRNPDIVLEDRFNLPRTEKGKQYNIPSSVETAYHTAYKNYLAQSGGDKQKLADIYNKLELQEMTPDIMVKKFGTKYETPPSRDSFLLAKTKGGIPYAKRLALETLLFGPDRPTAKEFASKKFGKGMQGPTLDNGGFLNNISQGILSGLGNAILPGIGGVLLPQGNELARMEDGGKVPYGGIDYRTEVDDVVLGNKVNLGKNLMGSSTSEVAKQTSATTSVSKSQPAKVSTSTAKKQPPVFTGTKQQVSKPVVKEKAPIKIETSKKYSDEELAAIKSEFPNFDPNEFRRKQQSINPTMSPIEQALFSFLGAKGAVTGTSAAIKVLQRLGKANKERKQTYDDMVSSMVDNANYRVADSKSLSKVNPSTSLTKTTSPGKLTKTESLGKNVKMVFDKSKNKYVPDIKTYHISGNLNSPFKAYRPNTSTGQLKPGSSTKLLNENKYSKFLDENIEGVTPLPAKGGKQQPFFKSKTSGELPAGGQVKLLNENRYSRMLDDYLNTPTATSKVVEKATPRRKGKYDELFDFKYGGKLPKVIQSISPIADLFVPGLGSAMGILGAGISAVEAKKDRRMEQNSKFSALGANTNPYGYAHGGMLKGRHDLSYYKGRSHATGGIMVNSNAVPSDNVSAEVEGKEARFSVGGKTYIFSERLKI